MESEYIGEREKERERERERKTKRERWFAAAANVKRVSLLILSLSLLLLCLMRRHVQMRSLTKIFSFETFLSLSRSFSMIEMFNLESARRVTKKKVVFLVLIFFYGN